MASRSRSEAHFRQQQSQSVDCARRLFQEHRSTASRSSVTRQHTASSFYTTRDTVPESPHHWGPGDYIQPEPQHSVMDLPHDILAEMQSSISSELSKLSKAVSDITTRMEKLEESVALNTAKLQVIADSTTISPIASLQSAHPSGTSSRRRRTPTGLSNLVRTIHNNLPDEKKMKNSESIDSEHNRKVVEWVVLEMPSTSTGTGYTTTDVKKALQTYKKTLARPLKESEQSRRLKRSRQQKKYERRGRYIKQDERKKWEDVLPSMMSDEEECQGRFKVHRPVWRSSELNQLFDELDERSLQRPRPRLERFLGTPCKDQPPPNIRDWLLSSDHPCDEDILGAEEDDNETLAPNSPQIF